VSYSYSGNVNMTVHVDVVPVSKGRARRFDSARRALARRLRIPMVRQTLWEQRHPESRPGRNPVEYSHHWTSTSALANASFACECHKRERYSRKHVAKAD
jgi:hypothetical protein